MPEKLSIAEMAYLSGLLLGVRSRTEMAPRLEALGFIEMGDVPAPPALIKEFETRLFAWRAETRRLVCAGMWDAVRDCPADLRASSRPVFERDYVLTAAGRRALGGR